MGDFALFVYYLTFVTDSPSRRRFLAQYKQTGVAFARMGAAPGAPPAALVAHRPLYLSGPLPPVPAPRRTPADRLEPAGSDAA